MDKILSFVLRISIFSLFSTLFSILFPDGKLKKAGKFIMTLSMLFLMLYPFHDIVHRPEHLFENPTKSTENQMHITQKETYEAALKKNIENKLKSENIFVDSISMVTNFDEQNYLVIEKITIALSSIYKKETVASILEAAFDIPKEMIIFENPP